MSQNFECEKCGEECCKDVIESIFISLHDRVAIYKLTPTEKLAMRTLIVKTMVKIVYVGDTKNYILTDKGKQLATGLEGMSQATLNKISKFYGRFK